MKIVKIPPFIYLTGILPSIQPTSFKHRLLNAGGNNLAVMFVVVASTLSYFIIKLNKIVASHGRAPQNDLYAYYRKIL